MVKGKFGPPRLAANLARDLPPCSASYDSVESLCHSFSPGSKIQLFARKDSRCVVQADSRLWKNLSASLMHIDSGKIVGPSQIFRWIFCHSRKKCLQLIPDNRSRNVVRRRRISTENLPPLTDDYDIPPLLWRLESGIFHL